MLEWCDATILEKRMVDNLENMGGNREWLDWSEITVRDYRSSVQLLMNNFLKQSYLRVQNWKTLRPWLWTALLHYIIGPTGSIMNMMMTGKNIC